MAVESSPSLSRWDHPWLRRAGLLAVSLILLWLVGWALVPVLTRHQLESGLSEQLGRRVSVGDVAFKPWSLALAIDDLAVASASGHGELAKDVQGPQLAIKRIYIDVSWQTLWRLAPVLDTLSVQSPRLHVTYLGDGRSDLDDVVTRMLAQPAAPGAAVLRFALSNGVLSDGTLVLEDRPRQRTHRFSQFQLRLPFLSSLEAHRDDAAHATLGLEVNGQHLDVTAEGLPFAEARKGLATVKTQGLDLAPYLAYLPSDWPLTLRAAHLDADLSLAFQPSQPTGLTLSGQVAAHAVRLAAPGARPGNPDLLNFEHLTMQLKAVRPLAKEVQLGHVEWQAPQVALQRDRSGRLNWLELFKSTPASSTPAADAPASAWKLGVEQFDLKDGQIAWSDATTTKPARLRLDALVLQARSLAWPLRDPIAFEGSAQLEQAGLQFQGSATDQVADVSGTLRNASLHLAAPYLAAWLTPTLAGVLQADAKVHWQSAGPATDRLRVQLPSVRLDKLAVLDDKKSLASVARIELADLSIAPDARSVRLGSARVNQPTIRVTRNANGRWMVEDWLKTPSKSTDVSVSKRPTSRPKPWSVMAGELRISGGSVAWRDASTSRPVAFDLDAVSVQLRQVSTAPRQRMGLSLNARMRHGHAESGQLGWRGNATLTPLVVQGNLNAERLPMHALAPYLSDRLNVVLRRADASFKGGVRYARPSGGTALKVQGDARLEDVEADTLAQSEPFVPAQALLNLKDLSLSGLDLVMQPGSAMQLAVRETVLSDFYARVILHENGRFNLQDLIRSPVAVAPEPVDKNKAVAAVVPAAPVEPEPVIRLGPMSLQGGRVDFTDHFIQPNYATQLSDLTGRLGAFASRNATDGALQLADLELRGRAEGSATLEVLGKINPLAQPLALDVQGRVRDLELSPLSTYSARYAGYGIERGKLSVDVAYKVDPDGQLTARNDIVLNQLKFGDAVPGAKNSLPVKLAVALLADRNGVIDINLPISGSLKDPQFRLMPIVFRIIGNLIMKAVTAPFSLLARVFSGGGDALSAVHFAPGTAVLDAKARADLNKVAQALRDRPALKMTVVASANLAAEREAFQRAQLQSLVQTEQRRRAAPGTVAGPVMVSAQDYPDLLKAVYRRAAFPKPRNWMGLIKDIPVADMEALLLANQSATEADMQVLAMQRGVAVRDYLAGLQLPMDRLFLGAAKTQGFDAAWQPQAELKLSTD